MNSTLKKITIILAIALGFIVPKTHGMNGSRVHTLNSSPQTHSSNKWGQGYTLGSNPSYPSALNTSKDTESATNASLWPFSKKTTFKYLVGSTVAVALGTLGYESICKPILTFGKQHKVLAVAGGLLALPGIIMYLNAVNSGADKAIDAAPHAAKKAQQGVMVVREQGALVTEAGKKTTLEALKAGGTQVLSGIKTAALLPLNALTSGYQAARWTGNLFMDNLNTVKQETEKKKQTAQYVAIMNSSQLWNSNSDQGFFYSLDQQYAKNVQGTKLWKKQNNHQWGNPVYSVN